LREGDYIATTHRGHGHLIARGTDIKGMMAEIFGKRTGLCKGNGGSMHIADFSKGIIGASGIVAGGLSIATGAGLASKMRNEGKVSVSFFGDGASNQGAFHESLNLAAVWSLPVIYVLEHNLYGMMTHHADVTSVPDLAVRAKAYGMPGVTVDGNDPLAVYEAAAQAVARAREGAGPTLLECKTYRYHGHFEGEPMMLQGLRPYRSEEEIEAWRAKDAVKAFRIRLLESGTATESQLAALDEEVRQVISEAVAYGQEGPLPEPEQALEYVFKA
jgi:pyruvate dehydrogenase E1 component alpha subunit